jgi:hypothetical protein
MDCLIVKQSKRDKTTWPALPALDMSLCWEPLAPTFAGEPTAAR